MLYALPPTTIAKQLSTTSIATVAIIPFIALVSIPASSTIQKGQLVCLNQMGFFLLCWHGAENRNFDK